MTYTQKLLYAAGVLSALAAVVASMILFGIRYTPEAHAIGGGTDVSIAKPTIASSTQVQTTSTVILATSTSRTYAEICNDSSNLIFINFGNAAIIDNGIRIQSGSCYNIGSGNLVHTAVNGVASSTVPLTASFIDVSGAQRTYGS